MLLLLTFVNVFKVEIKLLNVIEIFKNDRMLENI